MRVSVAKRIVLVALLAATAPAVASNGPIKPSPAVDSYTAYYDGHYGPIYNGYWTAKSEFFYSTAPGRSYVRDDGRHFRRVMITGYHPVEGFGPELIKEAAFAAERPLPSIIR